MATAEKFISKKEVCEAVGISQPTLWRWYTYGTFPKPVRLGPNRVAWVEREVDEWMAARCESRSELSSNTEA